MSPVALAVSEPAFELPRVWDGIAERAPELAETVTAYLDYLSARIAPRSVAAAEVSLRDFSLHVLMTDRSLPRRSGRLGIPCGHLVRRAGRAGGDRGDDQLQAGCPAALLRTPAPVRPS